MRRALTKIGLSGGVLAGLLACRSEPPPFVVQSITPDWAYNGESTPIVVGGDEFYPSVRWSAAGGPGAEDPYVILLTPADGGEAVPIEPVERIDREALAAEVPAGLSAGAWTLSVVSPFGAEAEAPERLTVRDNRADALDIDVDVVGAVVGESVRVTARLLDPRGALIAQDLAIAVDLSDEVGEPVAAAFGPGLVGQVVTADGAGVRGRLGDDGIASLTLQVFVPGTVTLRLRSTDQDERVSEDDAKVAFRLGDQAFLRFALPTTPFTAQAGESFDLTVELTDAFGNPVVDLRRTIGLSDSCGSWAAIAEVLGPTRVTWVPRRATGQPGCDMMRVRATTAGVEGSSEAFEVLPGPVSSLVVDVSPAEIVAGSTLNTFIRPVDAYGNDAAWPGGSVTLLDDGEPLDASSCTATVPVYCSPSPVRAGAGRVLTATASDGSAGTSDAYTVRPDVLDGLLVSVPAGAWTAGVARTIEVRAVDAWGNLLAPGALTADGIVVLDPRGEAVCEPGVVEADGRIVVPCTLFTAGEVPSLQVLSPAGGVGESGPLQVQNGPLATLSVVADRTRVVAGEALPVWIEGLDAWGNAWVVQDDPMLRLSDGVVALDPPGVQVRPDGTAEVDVRLLRAQLDAQVVVLSSGGVLGISDLVEVTAAPASRLDLSLEGAWAWVGRDSLLTVEAQDAYGNRADLDGPVVVASTTGAAAAVEIDLLNGLGVGEVRWTATRSADTLVASRDGGLEIGEVGPVLVVQSCPLEPVPRLQFGGRAWGLGCGADDDGSAVVSGSLATSSAAPGRSLLGYGLAIEGGESIVGTSPAIDVIAYGPGRRAVRGLAVQNDFCAAEVSAVAWIGPDDGSVVGELSLYVSPSVVDLDASQPTSAVQVTGALTCRGQPAAGAALRVRADRGAVDGATPTGQGLNVLLDAAGSAVFRLDAAGVDTGGVATLVAVAPSGAAFGTAGVTLRGDDRPPEVWSLTPAGALAAATDTLWLTFSEAVDPASVDDSTLTVQGPMVVPIEAFVWSLDGRDLRLDLTTELTPGTRWEVRVSDAVTDLAGNGLAGTWAGAPAAFVGAVGVGVSPPTPSACTTTTAAFRPDGDPGVDTEADDLVFSFVAPAAPFWWIVGVEDAGGVVVRQAHVAPVGNAGQWTWDGRSDGGVVVPAGSYRLRVQAESALGDRSPGCERVVELRQWGVR